MMNQVGDRALRNMRLNVAIVGIFLSVVGIGSTDAGGSTAVTPVATELSNFASYAAVAAAIVSLFGGLLAYVVTPTTVGFSVSDSKRAQEVIEEGVADREFLLLLLCSHENWIERNSRAQLTDSVLLNGSATLLLFEIEYFAVSVASVVFDLDSVTIRRVVLVTTVLTFLLLVLGLAFTLRYLEEWL